MTKFNHSIIYSKKAKKKKEGTMCSESEVKERGKLILAATAMQLASKLSSSNTKNGNIF